MFVSLEAFGNGSGKIILTPFVTGKATEESFRFSVCEIWVEGQSYKIGSYSFNAANIEIGSFRMVIFDDPVTQGMAYYLVSSNDQSSISCPVCKYLEA